jgi:hypothetical protein
MPADDMLGTVSTWKKILWLLEAGIPTLLVLV